MAKFKVICGLPGSGKSTYVKQHVGASDLVFDYDEISAKLTLKGQHIESTSVRKYLIAIRNSIIQVGKFDDEIKTIWIIKTVPDQNFKQLLNGADAEYYYISATVSECLDHINSDLERIGSNINWLSLLSKIDAEGKKGAFDICKVITQ